MIIEVIGSDAADVMEHLTLLPKLGVRADSVTQTSDTATWTFCDKSQIIINGTDVDSF